MKTMIGFLCALALAGVLIAESSVPLVAHMPFAFYVGEQWMRAGEYSVQREAGRSLVWVSPSEPGARAVYFAFGADAKVKESRQNLLVFNKYGERYFLSQIIHAGDNVASELTRSAREREIVTSTLVSGIRPTRVVIVAHVR